MIQNYIAATNIKSNELISLERVVFALSTRLGIAIRLVCSIIYESDILATSFFSPKLFNGIEYAVETTSEIFSVQLTERMAQLALCQLTRLLFQCDDR